MASSSESPSSIACIDDSQQPFQDAIHKLMNFSRPLTAELKTDLGKLLSELVAFCGSESSRWRTLVLTLTHKRYHFLSPTAREEALATGQKDLAVAGDGERLVFYSSFRFLLERVVDEPTTTEESKLLLAALDTMLKISPHAGGSRDICHLLVDMIEVVLTKNGTVDRATQLQMAVKGHASLPSLVGQCIQDVEKSCEDGIVLTLLGGLLQLAASTLDSDFEIIQRTASGKADQGREFPSTLHVFIPHRDRGRSKKPKEGGHRRFSERQLVNSVAEILIWSRTQKASTIPAFSESLRLLLEGSSRTANKQELTNLQTVVRTLRKSLNSYAREQGFMLSTQFAMKGSSKLSSRQVNGGKAGDLALLTRLATKKSDAKVLKLIQLRGAVGKATKFSSVREALVVPTVTEHGDAEIEAIERDIYLERLKATLVYLRSLMKSRDKSVVVASMDKCDSGHALAVLVVAAMSNWALSETDSDQALSSKTTAKLLIAGVQKDMSCMQDVADLLGSISTGLDKNELDVPSFMASDGAATTKAVMNTIDRHVQDSEVFLLVTGADITLPSDYMKALSDRGCSMHCHDSDDIGARLERELARKGDITVSLSWNTKDDLDLHVFVPGGEEIYYSHKHSKDGLCGLDVDMNAGGGQTNEPVENVFLGDLDNKKQAPLGQYKVVVRNYAYHSSPHDSAVPFLVIVEKNGKKEKYDGHCKGAGDSSDVVACEFTYEGRSVPFPGDEKETAFQSSQMVNMTASTGQTLEALGQLVQIAQQHEQIAAVRPLLAEEEAESEDMLVDGVEVPTGTLEVEVPGTLEVTSQDLINILLAKLPVKFHQIVGEAFGGQSLAESCAESIARRMVTDRIPIAELKRNGFPDDIVQAVKVKMATVDAL